MNILNCIKELSKRIKLIFIHKKQKPPIIKINERKKKRRNKTKQTSLERLHTTHKIKHLVQIVVLVGLF